jgi:hypothetical protein
MTLRMRENFAYTHVSQAKGPRLYRCEHFYLLFHTWSIPKLEGNLGLIQGKYGIEANNRIGFPGRINSDIDHGPNTIQ